MRHSITLAPFLKTTLQTLSYLYQHQSSVTMLYMAIIILENESCKNLFMCYFRVVRINNIRLCVITPEVHLEYTCARSDIDIWTDYYYIILGG